MICAASGSHIEVVKFLLEFGADVNAADYDGRTSLHHAVINEDYGIVELLVQRNDTIINKLQHEDHLSALDLASLTGNNQIIRLLKESGGQSSNWIILFATLKLQKFWRACKKNRGHHRRKKSHRKPGGSKAKVHKRKAKK
jgi:ankyrin repeat protein